MKNEPTVRNSSISYLAIRRILGVLGILLPLLILAANGFEGKSSISHFYYSPGSVIFTGFMCAFGVFLILYPGRDDGLRLSDNRLTTAGGVFAILTALVPTAYFSDIDCNIINPVALNHLCSGEEVTTQFIHNNSFYGNFHLISAALFLTLMGYMSYYRFTKGNMSSGRKLFYRFCAIMVWLPLVVIGVKFATNTEVTKYDVYILEWISIGFFGIAWLVKGKGLRYVGLAKK